MPRRDLLVISLKTAKARCLTVAARPTRPCRRGHRMRRRDLLAVLGGAAVAAPVAARAQQKAMPVISYLAPDAPSASASGIAAWREGLAQSGFLEGRNVVVEYRSGSGDYGRMPARLPPNSSRSTSISSWPRACPPQSPPNRPRRGCRSRSGSGSTRWLSAWCRASIRRGDRIGRTTLLYPIQARFFARHGRRL